MENLDGNLQRGLKRRHISMIAIGGAIGTGLFVASGGVVSTAGPGGALLAYIIMGLLVYFLMTSLGEMATAIPTTGSFANYCTRFVDPALGFSVAWNYWYSWSITVAFELVAASIVMKFWLPDVPGWIWSAIFFCLLYGLNFFSAKAFGEAEFWFAGIKVVAIIVFLIAGLAMILGILGGNSPGFSNWFIAGPDGAQAPFVGGWQMVLYVFLIAGFSFQGTELVGIAAGESENPTRDVPKAINSVFWRIMIFYIGAIAIIAFLVPFTDPNLLKSGVDNIAYSPFTIVFERAGWAIAASVMNAVVLTSVLSCGNSGLYVSTRMLYSLAVEGKAPKAFTKVNKRGVPILALNVTAAICALCFLTTFYGDGVVYNWLLNASALTGFIAWLSIAWSHYAFRRAYVAQGKNLADLKYKALFYPVGPILAFILCLGIICGQIWTWGSYDLMTWLVAYIGVPLFIVLYLGYKIVKKTKIVKPLEADFDFVDLAVPAEIKK